MHLRNIEGSPSRICSVERIPVLQQRDTPPVGNCSIAQRKNFARSVQCETLSWPRGKMLSIFIPISIRECSLFLSKFYLKLFSYSRSLKALIKIISLTTTMTLDKCISWKIFSNDSKNILAEYHTSCVSQNSSPPKRYPLLRSRVVPFQRDRGTAISSLDRAQHAFTPCLNCRPLSEALRGEIGTLH